MVVDYLKDIMNRVLSSDFITANTLNEYLIALGIFVGLFIAFKIFDMYIVYIFKKAAKKTKTSWDDFLIDFIDGIHWPFYAYISVYIAALYLVLPELIDKILSAILVLFIGYYAAKGLTGISDGAFDRYKEKKKKEGKNTSDSMISVLKFLAKLVVWIFVFLMILNNFGVEITPLIAGLGVGGIAIGLALQNVLGDLFSAFALYFDKPFEEGDFIIVGNDMGVVKYIGIKTTRLEALGGQELVFSNSELTSTRINNYKKMNFRRVVFGFGVEYKTSVTKLKKIKKLVEDIVDKKEHAKLDRVHFKEFGDSALMYEVVYYVDTNDYNVYMDVQEDINFKIKEAVEKQGVGFAFPTRTVYMKKE